MILDIILLKLTILWVNIVCNVTFYDREME